MKSFFKFYIVFAFLGILFISVTSIGQVLPFTNYNSANGLIHNRTHSIKQDGMGYIWVGTDLGICRFDGRNFKHFPCPKKYYNSARYAIQYKDAVCFAVDWFGIAICKGDSVRFIEAKVDKVGLAGGVACLNDSMFLFNYIPIGLSKLNINGTVSKVKFEPTIIDKNTFSDLFKDSKNNLWECTSKGLVFAKNTNTLNAIYVPFFKNEYINCVREDINGDIYIACEKGVYKYDAKRIENIKTVLPQKLLIPKVLVASIAFSNNDFVWLASEEIGLIRYNKRTKNYKTFGVRNGLISFNAWDVFRDIENNIWVATEIGLSKLSTNNFVQYDFRNEVYPNVKSACRWDDTTILVSNLVNVYSIRNDNFQLLSGYNNLVAYTGDLFVKTIDNQLLIEVNEKDFNSLTGTKHSYFYNFQNNRLIKGKAIAQISGGANIIYLNHGTAIFDKKMWLHSDMGLQVYKEGKFFTAPQIKVKNQSLTISYIARNKQGDLWIVDNRKSIHRFSIVSSPDKSFPYQLVWKETISEQSLLNHLIAKIFVDSKSNVWICGGEKGLSLATAKEDGSILSINNFAENKCSSGIITSVAEDEEYNIWVGTAQGLDKINFVNGSPEFQKDLYGSELCGKYIFFVKSANEKLYVGTTGCVGVIAIKNKEENVPPKIYISQLKVNEKLQPLFQEATTKFKPHENNFSFTFTGLSFKDERRIQYSYKLDGVDEKWSSPSTEHSVTYSRIPAGAHTFRVKALSAQGVWSVRAAEFSFVIAQPFYTTWWFVLLIVLLISAIIYTIYRYRINQLLAIHHIRQNISKDLHDDIGATVSSINILANIAKSDLISESKRNQFLQTIQDETKHVSQSISDIVWSINPKNDSLEVMFARMQRYASELFEAANIDYEFTFPNTKIDDSKLDIHKRQHLYLIFKEGVNNLVKYANSSTATIHFEIQNQYLKMTIADNGKGFDVQKNTEGNGILNMKKRAEEIKGTLELESQMGIGTKICLSLKM